MQSAWSINLLRQGKRQRPPNAALARLWATITGYPLRGNSASPDALELLNGPAVLVKTSGVADGAVCTHYGCPERPLCPVCQMRMITTDRIQDGQGFEHCEYKCLRCGHVEVSKSAKHQIALNSLSCSFVGGAQDSSPNWVGATGKARGTGGKNVRIAAYWFHGETCEGVQEASGKGRGGRCPGE